MATQETQPPLDGDSKGEAADSSTVDQCLTMLRRKDDTSRFVGLAILSSLLNHIQDPGVLSRCLDSLDPRFLDRLLRAGKPPPIQGPGMLSLLFFFFAKLLTKERKEKFR